MTKQQRATMHAIYARDSLRRRGQPAPYLIRLPAELRGLLDKPYNRKTKLTLRDRILVIADVVAVE